MTPVAAVDHLFEAHLIVADLDVSIAFYQDRRRLELAHVILTRRASVLLGSARGATRCWDCGKPVTRWTGSSAAEN